MSTGWSSALNLTSIVGKWKREMSDDILSNSILTWRTAENRDTRTDQKFFPWPFESNEIWKNNRGDSIVFFFFVYFKFFWSAFFFSFKTQQNNERIEIKWEHLHFEEILRHPLDERRPTPLDLLLDIRSWISPRHQNPKHKSMFLVINIVVSLPKEHRSWWKRSLRDISVYSPWCVRDLFSPRCDRRETVVQHSVLTKLCTKRIEEDGHGSLSLHSLWRKARENRVRWCVNGTCASWWNDRNMCRNWVIVFEENYSHVWSPLRYIEWNDRSERRSSSMLTCNNKLVHDVNGKCRDHRVVREAFEHYHRY